MRYRDRARVTVAMIGVASVAATGGLAMTNISAQAADLAYGFESVHGRLGTVWVNGIPVACIDPFGGHSSRVPSNLTPSFSNAGMSDQNAAGLNMVMLTFARPRENVTGAAVVLSAWTLKDAIISHARNTGYRGNNARAAAEWFSARAGRFARAVMAKYDEIMAAVADVVVASPDGNGGRLTFNIDRTNNYLGTLTVHNLSPVDAVGTLSLTNGIFTATGSATISGVTNGTVLNVRAIPPNDAVDYKISVVGDFTGTGNGWRPQIAVFDNPAQTMAGPGPETVATFRLSGEDSASRSTIFRPILQTTVPSAYLKRGDTFKDTLRFSTVADTSGLNNPWPQRMNGYLEVTAVCTVYGNYSRRPLESDDAPPGSPVGGRFTVTTTASAGPSIDYVGETNEKMPESGFYTAQCAIVADTQPMSTRRFIPTDYSYRDRIGQDAETSVVPMELEVSTRLSITEIGIGESLTDTVTTKLINGPWLRDAHGNRYSIPFTYTRYLTPPEEGGKPRQAATPPPTAQAVLTGTFTINSPDPVSYQLTAPMRGGWLSVVVCITPADLPAELVGIVVPGCDNYGVPPETVHIIAPHITTQATRLATTHDPLNDTATIKGRIPTNTVLEFELFKRVEAGDAKLDENGRPRNQLWTQSEIDALGDQAYCAIDNRVTKTERVAVKPGINDRATYDSPRVFVTRNSVYWWVESLIHLNPDTGEERAIHRGTCGLPNETTTVNDPKVTTRAVPDIELGNLAHDTAIVVGPVPGESSGIRTQLTFEAFEKKSEQPVCTPDNRVANLTDPIIVTKEGKYAAADVAFTRPGGYWWVETLASVHIETGETTIIHTGTCGLLAETTRLSTTPTAPPAPQHLATAGIPVIVSLASAMGLLGLGGALLVTPRMLRSNRTRRGRGRLRS